MITSVSEETATSSLSMQINIRFVDLNCVIKKRMKNISTNLYYLGSLINEHSILKKINVIAQFCFPLPFMNASTDKKPNTRKTK